LMTAMSGLSPEQARADGEFYGRLVESAIGAYLVNEAARGVCELYYWRQGDREVDFVVRAGQRLYAIEVKSSIRRDALSGVAAFRKAFEPDRSLLIGADGIDLAQFLSRPLEDWVDS
ncbi:MAG: DUF4143 domain-containing protein, partial [Wenzhouxiangellaceae bacterium]